MHRVPLWIVATILIALLPRDALAEPLRAFATSTLGNGNLASWPEVASTDLVGLDAADGICRAHALAAALDAPERYVAWLSDRDSDAYCRVLGLAGKKADRCGEADLPTKAGPWFRTDGTPFAATIAEMTQANVVYAPLDVDEFGLPIAFPLESFSATDARGAFDTEFGADVDCQQWTSESADQFATLGWNFTSSEGWTQAHSGAACSATRRLMCLESGTASTPKVAPSGRREAFVTSVNVTGNLGGLAGADATCTTLASAAGLYRPDTFKALLASSTAHLDATARFVFDGPWFRRDGLLFAHDKAELASGVVTLPLNVTEQGEYIGFAGAPTGANIDGSPREDGDCAGWTSAVGTSPAALINGVQGPARGWFDAAGVRCGPRPPREPPLKLMCLADVDVMFHAEFD